MGYGLDDCAQAMMAASLVHRAFPLNRVHELESLQLLAKLFQRWQQVRAARPARSVLELRWGVGL